MGLGEANVLKSLLFRLGRKYGEVFVKTTCLLLSAVQFGITAQELEELLWANPSVRSEMGKNLSSRDAFPGNGGSESEIRSAIGASLCHFLNCISSILHRKYFYGCEVYCWSNTRTKQLVTSFYISEDFQLAQKSLTDYYIQYVLDYPLPRKTPFKSVHVCIEMHCLLYSCGKRTEIMQHCLLNYGWLFTVLQATRSSYLLQVLQQVYRAYNDRCLLVLERVLRLACPVINRSKLAFAGEMQTRLLPFVQRFPALEELVSQCKKQRFPDGTLLPAGMHAQAPGAPLRVSFTEAETINDAILTYEGQSTLCLVYCSGKLLKMFALESGDLLREVVFKEGVEWIKLSQDQKVVKTHITCPFRCFNLLP